MAARISRGATPISRAAPAMARILPERVLAAIAQAIELNALSQELDRRLLAGLPGATACLTVGSTAMRIAQWTTGPKRERQIQMVNEFGAALDIHAQAGDPRALVAMRHPARAVGLAALQSFLERGFAAFRKMRGAATFLATIEQRERELMKQIMFA
jgi:hypothetical protein